jgi:2-methylcitrate dehydratase
MSEQETVKELARWALAQDADKLPRAAIEQAKMLVLDSLGCGFAAKDEHEPGHAIAAVKSLGGAPHCTVIGHDFKTSAVDAVLANGILIRHLDMNDFFVGMSKHGPTIGGHPSDNIVVALAVGEWKNSSGKEALASIVLGYEIYDRCKELQNRDSPWDGTTVSGLVAAIMAGRLMKLDAEKLSHALALSAARAVTPSIVRSGKISAAKFLSNPLIAQSGVQATILAAAGLTGPLAVLDDEDGIRSYFNADPARLAAPIKTPVIVNAGIKSYPCLATGQGTAAAGIEMHKLLKGDMKDIESIDVVMAVSPSIQRQQEDQDRRYPNSREAADHSFYFIAAVAMTDGELTPRQFDNERWTDPAITGLMTKMTMKSDKKLNELAPFGYPCAIRVVKKGGKETTATIGYPPGFSKGDGKELSADVVKEKFGRVTRDALDQGRRKAIENAVDKLESTSVADLMKLVGAR